MRKFVLQLSVLFLFVTLFSVASPASAGWHDLTQAQRNQAIVDEANSWSNGSDGGQCKEWVQSHVVWDASEQAVWLPTNDDYCSWNYHPYVVGMSTIIDWVNPGEIIQMKLSSTYGGGPHTLIVTANDGEDEVTVKESNWCANDCEEVGSRTLTYQQFYDMVDCYSVYYIL